MFQHNVDYEAELASPLVTKPIRMRVYYMPIYHAPEPKKVLEKTKKTAVIDQNKIRAI